MWSEGRRSIAMCGRRRCCVITLSTQGYRQGLRQSEPASLLTEGTCLAYQPLIMRYPLIDCNHPSCRQLWWQRFLLVIIPSSQLLILIRFSSEIGLLTKQIWELVKSLLFSFLQIPNGITLRKKRRECVLKKHPLTLFHKILFTKMCTSKLNVWKNIFLENICIYICVCVRLCKKNHETSWHGATSHTYIWMKIPPVTGQSSHKSPLSGRL